MDESNQFYPASTDDDLLPVVDEYDKVIEIQRRRQVHLGRLRHRAVQIGVVTPEGRVWLQKRSQAKDAWPGAWDLSSTGHVDAGESYDEAARRELREELGIENRPAFVTKVEACERTGWEFQSLYALRWAGEITEFNRQEIEQMRAFTLEEIREMMRGNSPLGRLTPCVAVHLPPILRALGVDPAIIEEA